MDKYFEGLWNEFSNDLLKYIQSKVSNTHDAEDILQEVYVKLYRKIDTVKDKAALKS